MITRKEEIILAVNSEGMPDFSTDEIIISEEDNEKLSRYQDLKSGWTDIRLPGKEGQGSFQYYTFQLACIYSTGL